MRSSDNKMRYKQPGRDRRLYSARISCRKWLSPYTLRFKLVRKQPIDGVLCIDAAQFNLTEAFQHAWYMYAYPTGPRNSFNLQ